MANKIIFWVSILIMQFLVLNHLDISAYLVPQVFVLLLITLPIYLPKNYQILIAFGLGLLADLFVSTPGIHASGCLWLILIRMMILERQDMQEVKANKADYSLSTVGISSFSITTVILVVFYHFYVLLLESIGAINGINLLLTALVSSMFALTVITIIEYIRLSSRR